MDMKLEVLFIPVADVDRAKRFYEKLGFRLDIDVANEDFRAIQFSPPGSEAPPIATWRRSFTFFPDEGQ
jgi:catechol 2,3-dioxygenase-like lactoylglutathione lyase family enzyme